MIKFFCEKVIFEIESLEELILFFFTKLIAKQIYSKYLTFKLPRLYCLLFGIQFYFKAFENQNKYIGVTLHLVDSSKNNGKVSLKQLCQHKNFH